MVDAVTMLSIVSNQPRNAGIHAMKGTMWKKEDICNESGLVGGGDEEEVEKTKDAESDEKVKEEGMRINAEEDKSPYDE